MKGLWLHEGQLTFRQDLAVPAPAADEALVSVSCAGICGTDLEMLDGYAGFTGIPGHEFVGVVSGGPDEWVGRRVVAEINLGCGGCDACAAGIPAHCARRRVLGIRDKHGAFAAQLSVPTNNLHLVPSGISDEVAVLIEPLAAALEITEQVEFRGDERVLIVGAGRLAQLVAQVLLRFARSVDVLARNRLRRPAFEIRGLGLTDFPGHDYDVVVECSGGRAGFDTAIAAVRPRGTVIMKSTVASPGSSHLNEIVVNEITLVGSRCGPFAKAIAWLGEGRIRLSHLEFERYPLADYEIAFNRARSADVYKVLLVP